MSWICRGTRSRPPPTLLSYAPPTGIVSRRRYSTDSPAAQEEVHGNSAQEETTDYSALIEKIAPLLSPPAATQDKLSRKERRRLRLRETQLNLSPMDPNAPWDLFGSEPAKRSRKRDAPRHLNAEPPFGRRIEDVLDAFEGDVLEDLTPISEQRPIARLTHGLERLLFNPGVCWLQEPRSQVYNFTPWLQNIPNVKDFAFERITGFVKSSRDQDLWNLAEREERIYAGSTSSLTGLLSHIYFLISGDRPTDLTTLSGAYSHAPSAFTIGSRMATLALLNHRNGRYAIDSEDHFIGESETNILTWQGHMLEKFLTSSPLEFKQFLRSITPQYEEPADRRREAYRYSKSRRMVMRSQLDCVDPRLPGTGVFDLKTRAALPIRMDRFNYQENSGYMIRSVQGPRESFEKEYFDLIRSAFLKYSFQARIGNMDGVLVTYHNTARIFGFQYVPLEEMEQRLYGGRGRGDRVFERCVSLLEMILPETTRCFPNQSVCLMVETQEGRGVMNIWVQPADWNKENGHPPTVQLDVTAKSYVSGVEVPSPNAIASASDPTAPWSIRYSISHMLLSEQEIQYNMNAARERLFRHNSLPSGVDVQEMEEHWKTMFFGGVRHTAPFDPSHFKKADRFVESLRERSRAGREYLERLEQAAEGKPKVVVGPYEPYEPLPPYTPPDVAKESLESDSVAAAVVSGSPAVLADLTVLSGGTFGSASTPDSYEVATAPGLEYASSSSESPASESHTPEPHIIANAAPDFESGTGEVNPESSLVHGSVPDPVQKHQ